MKKQIPNIITSFRIVLALAFPIVFLYISESVAIFIFIFATLTDLIDGFLARKWNVISLLGARLDIIADKTLAFSSMIIIILKIDHIASYLLFFESIIIIIGAIYFFSKKELKSTKTGKIKTVFLFTTLSLIVFDKYITSINIIIYIFIALTSILQLLTALSYIVQGSKKNEKEWL